MKAGEEKRELEETHYRRLGYRCLEGVGGAGKMGWTQYGVWMLS